ncbi:hypothetical protein GCM10010276_21150 [Streptomyces longisporus]|uniref:Uncharacterized protein n=1 Tax=Streptomyces longisporus TaxID=1948 RepID=A0ABN3LGA2_STRLO
MAAAVSWAWPPAWFRTPVRPVPKVLHSFALELPQGAHHIASKDYRADRGDEASIRFTVTRQELAQFMSTLRTGTVSGPSSAEPDEQRGAGGRTEVEAARYEGFRPRAGAGPALRRRGR